jgi:hypothetical protein
MVWLGQLSICFHIYSLNILNKILMKFGSLFYQIHMILITPAFFVLRLCVWFGRLVQTFWGNLSWDILLWRLVDK